MKITKAMTDAAIAEELYNRLEVHRKNLSMTQEDMSNRIGTTRKTYRAMRLGVCKLSMFIAVLRHLDLLDGLELIAAPVGDSPMDALSRAAPKLTKRKRGNSGGAFMQGNPKLKPQGAIKYNSNPIMAARQKLITRGNHGR